MENYKKVIAFILIFLIPSLIVLAYFYGPPTTISLFFKKEIPTIALEEIDACSLKKSSVFENKTIKLILAKHFEINYKNSSFEVEICKFSSKEQAINYLNFLGTALPSEGIKKNSISLDDFSGDSYTNKMGNAIVLKKGEIILLCIGYNEVRDTENICKWFIENKLGEYS
jgi:hypothetical protein